MFLFFFWSIVRSDTVLFFQTEPIFLLKDPMKQSALSFNVKKTKKKTKKNSINTNLGQLAELTVMRTATKLDT